MPDEFESITELLEMHERDTPAALALLLPQGDSIREITWAEFARDVRCVAGAWQLWGLWPGEHVAQISRNRYEWILNDFALLMLGAVHVAISEQTTPAQLVEQLVSVRPRAVICDDANRWRLLLAQQPELSSLPCFIYEGHGNDVNIRNWRDWLNEYGGKFEASQLPEVDPKQPATIVFTSGTTGTPIGVMLSQRNLLGNAAAIAATFADEPIGRRLCWLPLNHLYARTADLYCWLARGSELVLVERPEDILNAAQRTQPDFLNAVPYFFDKLRRHVEGLPLSHEERAACLRELLGGKIRLMIAGGAPLAAILREFYAEHGFTIGQGYGLTEAGPVVATETLRDQRPGSVGRPLPGVEVRITADGEVLVRGRGVMSGYWQEPKRTLEKLVDGWLHTGDLGHLDDEGFLYIEGRCDEVLALSTGRKVSPQSIELALLDEPLIQQIVVVGQGRKHLAALIVPNPDALRAEIIQRAIPVTSREQALVHPAVVNLYLERIAAHLTGRAEPELLRALALVDRGWTTESGEMTASLKLRRDVIGQNFAAEIERLYAGT